MWIWFLSFFLTFTVSYTQRVLALDSAQSCTVATCCTFNHNGQLLVAGCSDGVVRIFDLRRSDCIDSWTAHQGETLAIQLTADFTACYTLGSDGKVSGLSAASEFINCCLTPGIQFSLECWWLRSWSRHTLLLWNLDVHYHVHRCQLLQPILSQLSLVHKLSHQELFVFPICVQDTWKLFMLCRISYFISYILLWCC